MAERPIATALAQGLAARLNEAVNAFSDGEARWRRALMDDIAADRCDVILDAACGAGALVVALAKAAPGAIVMGLDPRQDALARARARALAAGVRVELILAEARDIASYVNELAPTRVICTFDDAQPPSERRAVLTAAHAALRPGGLVHVVEIEARPTRVPDADAPRPTHAMTDQLRQAGFEGVLPIGRFPLTTGLVRLYRGAVATPG